MDYVNNRKNLKHLRSLRTKKAKLQFMSGGRVTVAEIGQVVGNRIIRRYAAKIRGLVVGNDGEWLHDTPEEARQYGREVLAHWRAELGKMQADD